MNGQVEVNYETTPGTAEEYKDYNPVKGSLIFQHAEGRKFIDLTILPDNEPEGLETFYLNLTSARLLFPR